KIESKKEPKMRERKKIKLKRINIVSDLVFKML
ncbi:MAG: hypothetical protein ACI90V_012832, partial [Bacillariaceae sp.]